MSGNKVGYKHKLTIIADAGTYPTVADFSTGKLLGIAKDVDLESDVDMIETSSRGSSAKGYEYGQSSWSSGTKTMYVPADDALTLIRAAHFAKTKVCCLFQESVTTGDENFRGVALVKKFKVGEPLNGEVVYEIELQGDGALTRGVNA